MTENAKDIARECVANVKKAVADYESGLINIREMRQEIVRALNRIDYLPVPGTAVQVIFNNHWEQWETVLVGRLGDGVWLNNGNYMPWGYIQAVRPISDN